KNRKLENVMRCSDSEMRHYLKKMYNRGFKRSADRDQLILDGGVLGFDFHLNLVPVSILTERALLESLRARFRQEKIYTYIGSILIVINPFQFLPVYNPKYVKLYDNHTLGKLEPHIYAVADVAYHAMLQRRKNQCIVISGESGSGKTQSTNFLIHHLTALSQKGFASGVEQIILGAGPVLEVRN
uniref:Myosin motor domain-containing protein n=1 Tax=Monopterus albus TaxID=43700 RepID=A0A3Q3K0U5_MONAL